jgi:hypothetical protein
MIRTQIQLPDQLYASLKDMARTEEVSLADIIRRAGEYLLAVRPAATSPGKWRVPVADVGAVLVDASHWRELANARPPEELRGLLPGRKKKVRHVGV